ncbi:hypothetical protein F4781DRAFT_429972 [Annulohypoxylon bovei var. microspora]|nr:hypothetical protein F4781DRAFT_429972 [Annulohypoxylon bovei var. microspora]
MLVREFRRLAILIIPLFLFFYAATRYFRSQSPISYNVADWIQRISPFNHAFGKQREQHILDSQVSSQNSNSNNGNDSLPVALPSNDFGGGESVSESFESNPENTHTELFSVSTLDRKYFRIRFGDKLTMNPNVIPHPLLENIWIIVAHHYDLVDTIPTNFVELACDAAFNENGTELSCLSPPTPLPIAATGPGKCEGELQYASLNVGPHDARVFYGPRAPFIVYGSNSQETCFGQWIQDFRTLANWAGGGDGSEDANASPQEQEQESFFQLGTELRRPPPYSPMEKNWFLFWDPEGQMYAHYDIAPRRAFAKLDADGSAGANLALSAAAPSDEECMAKYMPQPGPEHESIHQATNSLSVTTCRRSDPSCAPSDANTFLLTIFQHKTFRGFHSVYEPYAMAFRRRAPFQVYGISRKPLWIHGRDAPSRMFYVTSVSWKERGRRYHGYLDDVLVLGFGIEDRETAGIDVLAGDLLAGLGLC